MTDKLKGHLLAIITVSIWSASFIISKLLLETLTPLQILYSRFVIAIIFLTILYPKFEKPKKLGEELLFLLIGGSFIGYFLFENSALQYTYSSNVSLMDSTIPLLTGLLSILVLKKRFFTVKSTIGLVLAYSGVVVIIINGSQFEGVEPLGDFLAFGAAVMFAIYSVVIQKIDTEYTLIQLTRKIFFYGLVVLTPIAMFNKLSYSNIPFSIPLIGALLFLAIISSSLAFIFWNHALKTIGSTKTNQYIYLIPIITTVLSAIILKEHITFFTIIGTLLILTGVYLSEQ